MSPAEDDPQSSEKPAGSEETAASPFAVKHWLPLPMAIWFWTHLRRVVVMVIGSTLIFAGIVMLVTPGPGLVTIWGGLLLLASEFAWARWALKVSQQRMQQLLNSVQKSESGKSRPEASESSSNRSETRGPAAVDRDSSPK